MKLRLRPTALILTCIIIPLVGFGCFRGGSNGFDNDGSIDREAILSDARKSGLIMDKSEIAQMNTTTPETPAGFQAVSDASPYKDLAFGAWRSGALADVQGGGGFGLAHARFEKGTFTFVAKMGGLTSLPEQQHYQGWLVKRGESMRVIRTGAPIIVEDQLYVIFLSSEDLSEFDFFVLTREANDGTTTSSEHLLEGTLR